MSFLNVVLNSPGWMALWTTWSSWIYPCSLQEGWARLLLKVCSNTNYSILRFALHHLQGLASSPSKAGLREICWTKAFYALFRDSTSFKIVYLFLLFLNFCFLFRKTKLFLEIAGYENKGYRYSKQMRTFVSCLRINNKDVLSCNAWYSKHCAFNWHLSLPLHFCKLLQMKNLKLFQEIIIAM